MFFDRFRRKKIDKKETFLYSVIIILTAIIVVLLIAILNIEEVDTDVMIDESVNQNITIPEPKIIQKTDEILEVEKVLEVKREITKNSDGSIFISAKLNNLDQIEEDLIFTDFVEDIKFKKKVNILESSIKALNGTLFPSKKTLNITSYGPGPVDEKATRINVVLLNINFDKESQNTGLYEMSFKPEDNVKEIIFDGAEIRSGKYILKLEQTIITVN